MGAIGQVLKMVVDNQEILGNTIGWGARKKTMLSGQTWNNIWEDGFSKGLENLNKEAEIFQNAKNLVKSSKDYSGKNMLQKMKTFFTKGAESTYTREAKELLENAGTKATKSKVREKALELAAKNATTKTAAEIAEKGTKSILKKIPIAATAMTLLTEVPDIISAFKNGDGGKQIGRSSLNIAGYAGGTVAATAIGTAICPGLGTVAGFIVGAIGGAIAGGLTTKLGNAIFGKSIKEQKEEALAQSEATEQTLQQNQTEMASATDQNAAVTGANYDSNNSDNIFTTTETSNDAFMNPTLLAATKAMESGDCNAYEYSYTPDNLSGYSTNTITNTNDLLDSDYILKQNNVSLMG